MSNFSEKIGKFDFPAKIKAVKPESSIRMAMHSMQKNKLGCVIVSNEQMEVLGIITERDILMKATNNDEVNIDKDMVKDIMTPHPTCMSVNDSIFDVAQTMMLGNFRHMVILDEDEKLRSVISIRDLMARFMEIIQGKGL